MVKDSRLYRALRGTWRRRFIPLALDPFLQFAPPGHFYSPVPSSRDVARHQRWLSQQPVAAVPGVDTRDAQQLALMRSLAAFMPPPFPETPTPPYRYSYQNSYFGYADSTVLYAMLRHFEPRRIVEVGSGFSSAVMLDTADQYLTRPPAMAFIEPYPDRLLGLLRSADKRYTLLELPVQDVPLRHFTELEANDILFIDSSHVVKIGSDVNWLLTNVLPALNRGVIVHIHDIFWPFEYPEEWLLEGRAWNEAYVVQAFLQFNSAFEMLWFTSYLAVQHRRELASAVPLALRDRGGSLWLRKNS